MGQHLIPHCLERAPSYFDYLLQKSRQDNDLKSVDGKIQAVNQVLPYLTKISNRMERVEQTKRVAEFFGFEESIIREELKKAARPKQEPPAISRSQIRSKLTPSEKYLLKAIMDNPKTAQEVIEQLSASEDYVGLESESIFRKAIVIFREEGRIDPGHLLERLDNDRDKDFVNQALFSRAALVVVSPKHLKRTVPTASVSYGFQSPQSVAQAVIDAGYKGPTVDYHP